MSSLQTNPAEIWEIAKNDLQETLSRETFNSFFKSITFEKFEEDTFFLIASDYLTRCFLVDTYQNEINEALQRASGRSDAKFSIKAVEKPVPVPQPAIVAKPITMSAQPRRLDGAIRSQSTFETFVRGAENEMAVAAAMGLAASISDPDGINPLFIFGSSGLGKTHLMHAIANRVFATNQNARICYTTCETFTNEFLNAMSQNQLPEFRRRYRDLDLLLVDDIQFLAGKERTQEEFFHTFNQLCINGCKIVLTSDRQASEIKIEDRLVSRFQQGIYADIKPPCLETRLAILAKKAEMRHFDFSQFPGIIEFVAQNITRNVRNLEGAVNTLLSWVSLHNNRCELSVDLVKDILKSYLSQEEAVKITPELIQKRVAEFYKIDVQKMAAKGRIANVAFARQVAMYLCSELTDMKLAAIGDAFGGRDHGTVIHAKKTVQNRIDTSSTDKHDVELLRSKLTQHG